MEKYSQFRDRGAFASNYGGYKYSAREALTVYSFGNRSVPTYRGPDTDDISFISHLSVCCAIPTVSISLSLLFLHTAVASHRKSRDEDISLDNTGHTGHLVGRSTDRRG